MSTADIIEELGHLTELKKLEIVYYTEWNDALDKSLVESLNRLHKLQYLTVKIKSGGEINLDGWVVGPRRLHKMDLRGSCWLYTLPIWMNHSLLLDLFFLEIGVRDLQQQDLEILGGLHALCYLDLKVDHENVRRFTFTIGAFSFPCLVACILGGFGGPVVFQQGAMPRLAHLSLLGFPAHEMREINGGFDLGLSNLLSLQKFTIQVRSGDASKEEVEEAKAAIKHEIQVHPNHPTLRIEDYE